MALIATPDLIASLGPGTILACSGRGVVSWLIELFTWSRFSHVSMVVRITQADLRNLRDRGVIDWSLDEIARWIDGNYIVEATLLNPSPCLLQRRLVRGVQVHRLYATIRDYKGRVWALRPVLPLTSEESQRVTDALLDRLGTEYDMDGAAISGTKILKWLPFMRKKLADRTTNFCSELDGVGVQALKQTRNVPEFEPGQQNPDEFVKLVVRAELNHRPEKLRNGT